MSSGQFGRKLFQCCCSTDEEFLNPIGDYSDPPGHVLNAPQPILLVPSFYGAPSVSPSEVQTIRIRSGEAAGINAVLGLNFPRLQRLDVDLASLSDSVDLSAFLRKHKQTIVRVDISMLLVRHSSSLSWDSVRHAFDEMLSALRDISRLESIYLSLGDEFTCRRNEIPTMVLEALAHSTTLRHFGLCCRCLEGIDFGVCPRNLQSIEIEELDNPERETALDLSRLTRLQKVVVSSQRALVLAQRNPRLRKLLLHHVKSLTGDVGKTCILGLQSCDQALVARLLVVTKPRLRELSLIDMRSTKGPAGGLVIDAMSLEVLFVRNVDVQCIRTADATPIDALLFSDVDLADTCPSISARKLYISGSSLSIVSTLSHIRSEHVTSLAIRDNVLGGAVPDFESALAEALSSMKGTLTAFASLTDFPDFPVLPKLQCLLCPSPDSVESFVGKVPRLALLAFYSAYCDGSGLGSAYGADLSERQVIYSSVINFWNDTLGRQVSLFSNLNRPGIGWNYLFERNSTPQPCASFHGTDLSNFPLPV